MIFALRAASGGPLGRLVTFTQLIPTQLCVVLFYTLSQHFNFIQTSSQDFSTLLTSEI